MPNVRADNSEEDVLSPEIADSVFVYRVLLFAGLRDAAQADAIEVRSSQPQLLPAELMRLSGEQFPNLAPFLPYIRLAINCEYSNLDNAISPFDEIAFIPPVSGGEEIPLVELTRHVIDTARVIKAARSRLSGGEGAVLTFEGVVRDNAKGQKVGLLEYECYEPMALSELRLISDKVRARWDLPCAITHRLGRVEIGEASIVICVASPHRAEAFEACRFAIDTVKKTVPIWKKEFVSDGSWWVENPAQLSSHDV